MALMKCHGTGQISFNSSYTLLETTIYVYRYYLQRLQASTPNRKVRTVKLMKHTLPYTNYASMFPEGTRVPVTGASGSERCIHGQCASI